MNLRIPFMMERPNSRDEFTPWDIVTKQIQDIHVEMRFALTDKQRVFASMILVAIKKPGSYSNCWIGITRILIRGIIRRRDHMKLRQKIGYRRLRDAEFQFWWRHIIRKI